MWTYVILQDGLNFQEESFCWIANKYMNLTQNKSCIVKHSAKNHQNIIYFLEEMHTPLKPFVINAIAFTKFVTYFNWKFLHI